MSQRELPQLKSPVLKEFRVMRLKKIVYTAKFPFPLKYLRIEHDHKTTATQVFPKKVAEEFHYSAQYLIIAKSVRCTQA